MTGLPLWVGDKQLSMPVSVYLLACLFGFPLLVVAAVVYLIVN